MTSDDTDRHLLRVNTAFRDLAARGTQSAINGKVAFLRGGLGASNWPVVTRSESVNTNLRNQDFRR